MGERLEQLAAVGVAEFAGARVRPRDEDRDRTRAFLSRAG